MVGAWSVAQLEESPRPWSWSCRRSSGPGWTRRTGEGGAFRPCGPSGPAALPALRPGGGRGRHPGASGRVASGHRDLLASSTPDGTPTGPTLSGCGAARPRPAYRPLPKGPPEMADTPALDRIRVGSAPDSWGVWFPDDPHQVPWRRFLDEVAEAGYSWIELGPYGYLPTDPARLTDEVDRRGLKVSAGTVFTGLHRGPSVWDATWEHVSRVAALTRAMGARHLVVIPSFWRDDKTAELLEPPELTAEQWAYLTRGMERLGREVKEAYGLDIVVHPHADTHLDTEDHVERFLDSTDSGLVNLCLDTGHYAYCGGDSVKLIETYGERVGYLHLKQVDPEILADVVAGGVPFGPAVQRGVMCEPPSGVPELEPVLTAAQNLGVELFAIVEQDMYPCEPDRPLPIAVRTRRFLRSCRGLTAGVRRPVRLGHGPPPPSHRQRPARHGEHEPGGGRPDRCRPAHRAQRCAVRLRPLDGEPPVGPDRTARLRTGGTNQLRAPLRDTREWRTPRARPRRPRDLPYPRRSRPGPRAGAAARRPGRRLGRRRRLPRGARPGRVPAGVDLARRGGRCGACRGGVVGPPG
ncbi:hypothetical protein GCM10020295_71650 [Streptomyces cinereospinus]